MTGTSKEKICNCIFIAFLPLIYSITMDSTECNFIYDVCVCSEKGWNDQTQSLIE